MCGQARAGFPLFPGSLLLLCGSFREQARALVQSPEAVHAGSLRRAVVLLGGERLSSASCAALKPKVAERQPRERIPPPRPSIHVPPSPPLTLPPGLSPLSPSFLFSSKPHFLFLCLRCVSSGHPRAFLPHLKIRRSNCRNTVCHSANRPKHTQSSSPSPGTFHNFTCQECDSSAGVLSGLHPESSLPR